MVKSNRLFKKFSLGIASIALIAPIALGNITNNKSNAHAAEVTEKVHPMETKVDAIQFKHTATAKQSANNALSGAKDIFVQKGNYVYTAKANGTNMYPSTMKKYKPVKEFLKIARRKNKALKRALATYSKTKSKKIASFIQNNEKYTQIAKVPNTPTPKPKPNKIKHRRNKNHLNNRINKKRNKIQKPGHQRRGHPSKTFVIENKKGQTETLEKSMFKRGTWARAKKTGFAVGPSESRVHTMFDRYQPDDKRAVVPRTYKIRPNSTVWIVGRHTTNAKKINQAKQAYYYDKNNRGWDNIGF